MIAPSDALYMSLAFSPHGNYFYFRKATDTIRTTFNLLRAPVLGGTPQLIARNVDRQVTASPDGQRIAYLRANDPEVGKFQVLVANPDGTNETLFYGGPFNEFPLFLSWSPDGKQIASIVPGPGDPLSSVRFRDVASAKLEAVIPSTKLQLNGLAWLPDDRGLAVTYQNNSMPNARVQIGFLSNSGEQFRTITNDTNSYQTLTLSADGRTLATVQQRTMGTLYLLPPRASRGFLRHPLSHNTRTHFVSAGRRTETFTLTMAVTCSKCLLTARIRRNF